MEPIEWVKYEKRNKYAGMMPLDVEIWERFIEKNPSAFDAVAYNVAVGEGTPLNTVVSEDTGGDINRLYQRKIDVVGKAGSSIVIVEIGPHATTAKIGQVQGYAMLFKRDYDQKIPVDAVVLTDFLMPEMEFLAKAQNVGVIVA